MRIISRTRLREFWGKYPDVEKELTKWFAMTRKASWNHPADVKKVFGARVDFVQVASGKTVTIFDITNNKYRLIASIHYDYPRVFVLRVLTHREYDNDKWKAEL
jgi:mRNA interferase HigB